MPEQISQTAADRLNALCDKVSVSHNLDPEIRRELCAHMEDELLAYISGQQRPTEEDALILVEKHFGDPAVIRNLLRSVHNTESNVSLFRRLLGLGVVTTAGALLSMLLWLTVICIAGKGATKPLLYLTPLMVPLLPWIAGFWWTRQARCGGIPWFERRPIPVLVSVIIVLAFTAALVQWATADSWRAGPGDVAVSGLLPVTLLIMYRTAVQCATVAAWAWWCDWPGFGTRRALFGAGAWALLHILLTLRSLGADVLLGLGGADTAGKAWALAGFASAWATTSAALGFVLYHLLLRRTRLIPST